MLNQPLQTVQSPLIIVGSELAKQLGQKLGAYTRAPAKLTELLDHFEAQLYLPHNTKALVLITEGLEDRHSLIKFQHQLRKYRHFAVVHVVIGPTQHSLRHPNGHELQLAIENLPEPLKLDILREHLFTLSKQKEISALASAIEKTSETGRWPRPNENDQLQMKRNLRHHPVLKTKSSRSQLLHILWKTV
uniref:VWFA domain-containing protein n=1 Tax=Ditylenchus dipsaci TaxID=166011 RepID=A0A915D5F0_9BILA